MGKLTQGGWRGGTSRGFLFNEGESERLIRRELCRNLAGYKLLLLTNRPGNPVDMIGSLRFRGRGPGVWRSTVLVSARVMARCT